jgi:hypothetical protein
MCITLFMEDIIDKNDGTAAAGESEDGQSTNQEFTGVPVCFGCASDPPYR